MHRRKARNPVQKESDKPLASTITSMFKLKWNSNSVLDQIVEVPENLISADKTFIWKLRCTLLCGCLRRDLRRFEFITSNSTSLHTIVLVYCSARDHDFYAILMLQNQRAKTIMNQLQNWLLFNEFLIAELAKQMKKRRYD